MGALWSPLPGLVTVPAGHYGVCTFEGEPYPSFGIPVDGAQTRLQLGDLGPQNGGATPWPVPANDDPRMPVMAAKVPGPIISPSFLIKAAPGLAGFRNVKFTCALVPNDQ